MPIDIMIPGQSEPVSNIPEFRNSVSRLKSQRDQVQNFDINYNEFEKHLIGDPKYESCRQVRKIPRIFREEKSSNKDWIQIISLTSEYALYKLFPKANSTTHM